jgi:thiol-disulfide isomerase/thioredoxin
VDIKRELRNILVSLARRLPRKKKSLKAELCGLVKLFFLVLGITILVVYVLYFLEIHGLIEINKAFGEVIHSHRPKRGLFWEDARKKKPGKKQEEKKAEPEPKPLAAKQKKEEEFEFPVRPDAPPVMKAFLQSPTEANAKEYLKWQYKYMAHLKKIGYSLRNAYLRYGAELYPLPGYPEGQLASVVYHDTLTDTYKRIISRFRDRLGLIYFYRKDCIACQYQKGIILSFLNRYDISVRGVAVDGDIDDELPFQSVYNPSLVEEYEVKTTPLLIAVIESDDGKAKVAGLGSGVTSLQMIEQQLVRFLFHEGFIKEKDLNPSWIEVSHEID